MYIKEEIIDLAKVKASEIGIRLVVCNSYNSLFVRCEEVIEDYYHSDYYIHI